MAQNDEIQARASNGDVEAQCALALLYELGIDREKDLAAAKRWWMVAAKAGHPWAQLQLARYFSGDKGEGRDAYAASQWLDRAAAQNMRPRQEAVAAWRSAEEKKGTILFSPFHGPLRDRLAEELKAAGFEIKLPKGAQNIIELLAENPGACLLVIALDQNIAAGLPALRTLNTLKTSVRVAIISQKIAKDSVAQWQNLQIARWYNRPESIDEISADLISYLRSPSHG